MGRIFVDDHADRHFRQNLFLDDIKKSNEFLNGAMLYVTVDHRAFDDIRCREQHGCSVSHRVVGHDAHVGLVH